MGYKFRGRQGKRLALKTRRQFEKKSGKRSRLKSLNRRLTEEGVPKSQILREKNAYGRKKYQLTRSPT